jgi:MFS family permease
MERELAGQKKGSGLRSIVRALRHRNFRLFFVGQSISLVGTWMQRVALGWLVYHLTRSAFLLGLVQFAGQIPTFVLAPIAGVLADRWNRHRMLVLTQTLAMLQALMLSYLVLTNTAVMWQVMVLSVVLGIVNAFDMPIRQSFMIEMIEKKEDLGNAIALNSSIVNGARLLGPSAAGILIAVVGEGVCFLLNGISYIAVIGSLLLMKIEQKDARPQGTRIFPQLKEGFSYVLGFEPIRAILLMLALVSLMGMPYMVLMPVFAKDLLHGGADIFGFLMGGAGVGALAGALYLASRRGVLGLGKLIPIAASVLGFGLMGFAFSRVFIWSLAMMLLTGFGQMVEMATSNTLLQTLVDDDKRGRVMSFYAMAFFGMAPIGSLLAGTLAGRIGAPWTVFIGGLACVVGAMVFALMLPKLREKARPVYIGMGILPKVASGVIRAAEPELQSKCPR